MEITLGLAFAAGLISFISPCVLPLVPAYIGYMGGRVTNTVAAQTAGSGTVAQSKAITRFSTGLHSLFFVFGFSLVFVGLGLLSTSFIQVVGGSNINAATRIIGRAGGIIIIVFGLHFMDALSWLFNWMRQRREMLNIIFSAVVLVMGTALIFWAFDIPPSPFAENATVFNRVLIALPIGTAFIMWLLLGGAFTKPESFWLDLFTRLEMMFYADTRQQMTAGGNTGFGSTALMGIVFAAGWTPCIGPIYGAILTLAANGGSIAQAGSMLLAYSLGLGIPFIITALLLDSAQGILRGLNRHMRTIKLVSGVFLILVGVLVASGQLQRLSTVGAQGQLGEFSYRMEECFTGAVAGDVAWGQLFGCVNGTAQAAPEAEEAAVGSITGAAAALPEPPANAKVGLNIGDIAPDFETFTPDGERVKLSELRGQVVLVNFWATWCPPCRMEMPAFQEVYEKRGGSGDFTVIAVNNREDAALVQRFAQDMQLTFPMVLDVGGRIQEQYAIQGYPSTFVIDPRGVIISQHVGALNAQQVDQFITAASS